MERPGAELANRPLHFFYICDCSGSMSVKGKMDSLNHAIAEALPFMREAAAGNPNAQVLVRAIKFSNGAHWHIQEPTPLEEFVWSNLENPAGLTAMGEALSLLTSEMHSIGNRALPPVFVLVSDGHPTDNFEKARQTFMEEPWAKKSVRLAIAIGEEADKDVLQAFIGEEFRNELEPLEATNPEELVKYIKWASTVAINAASTPTVNSNNAAQDNISSRNVDQDHNDSGNDDDPRRKPPPEDDDVW